MLKGSDIDFQEFDEVKLSYFDTNDKYKEYKILDVDNSWELSNYTITGDWQKLK